MYYAGIDLGATKIHAVVAGEDGTAIGEDRRPTPAGPTGGDVTEAILDAIRAACEEAGIDPGEIDSAGIASIGRLDVADGAVKNPANLPDAVEEIPLREPVARLIDSDEIYLHNDTNAGVIGERFFSENSPADMVYLTISTGIGAGVCVDGNVLAGWDGNAGEVGHMKLDPEGALECGCGKAGHWEAYCSGSNIPRFARHLHEQDPVETAVPLADADFTAADVFALAGEDDFADHVVARVADWNAMGITNVVQAFAPKAVYVGGGVALNNPELTLQPIRERIEEMIFLNVPEVKLTNLGEEVVVRGAVASAMSEGTGDPGRVGR